MNVLIVENNFLLKENFFSSLELKKKFNLIFLSSVNSVKKILEKKNFDYIIISSLNPKLNSFNVIMSLFKNKPNNKIIQIMEKNNDVKHNFSSYCLKKPLIINRLLAILVKPKKKNIKKKRFLLKNGLIFKKLQRTIFCKNKKILLTEKECEILEYLISKKKFIKKSDLLKNVWGFNSKVKTRTLETHIYRLRKKIKEKFLDEDFILNNKTGYLL